MESTRWRCAMFRRAIFSSCTPNERDQMSLGLVGRKVGMTRVFTDDGDAIPVTVLDVANNRVTQIKTPDSDGYAAVQVTFGKRRASRVAQAGGGTSRESRRGSGRGAEGIPGQPEELGEVQAGRRRRRRDFEVGQIVDVTGTTKGSGFARRHQPPQLHLQPRLARQFAYRTTSPARSRWRRIPAACFPASAWRASSAT